MHTTLEKQHPCPCNVTRRSWEAMQGIVRAPTSGGLSTCPPVGLATVSPPRSGTIGSSPWRAGGCANKRLTADVDAEVASSAGGPAGFVHREVSASPDCAATREGGHAGGGRGGGCSGVTGSGPGVRDGDSTRGAGARGAAHCGGGKLSALPAAPATVVVVTARAQGVMLGGTTAAVPQAGSLTPAEDAAASQPSPATSELAINRVVAPSCARL